MTAQKSALVIAYHYPPRGGVAVLRTIKFIKYLSRLGWRLKVLTLRTRQYALTDETLVHEVPASVDVVRLPDPGPLISRAVRALTMQRFSARGFPDLEAWWVPLAAAAATEAVIRGRIPVIYTTSPPHSTHLVADRCKRLTGARWVADFRDTWASNPFFVEDSGWRKTWKERLERKVVQGADVILANTPRALEEFVQRYPAQASKFVWLPNGYDPDDFTAAVDRRPEPRPLTLMYVGSMGDTRPFDYFFAALQALKREHLRGANEVEIVIVSPLSAKIQRLADEMGLTDQVRFVGQLPHAQAVDRMHSSDVLLLLQFANHGGRTALPSKVFEYLRAKKLIFAMTCEGPTSELIRSYEGGFVTEPDDVEAIRKVLAHLIDLHQRRALPVIDDSHDDAIERFSRKALADELDKIMTRLLTARGRTKQETLG